MSRSNPTAGRNPNPAKRWYEFKGKAGVFQYYDKDKEENIVVKLPFVFIVLDINATIRGYNKKAKSGIYSNEVRDTRSEPMVVKMFNGTKIATGLYADIKDSVIAKNGHFNLSIYAAMKKEGKKGGLELVGIHLGGCALGPFIEFQKNNQKEINTMAVCVKEVEKHTDGEIPFKSPVFSLMNLKPETDEEAKKIDAEILQPYLKSYFGRPVTQRAAPGEEPQDDAPKDDDQEPPSDDDVPPDDVPF